MKKNFLIVSSICLFLNFPVYSQNIDFRIPPGTIKLNDSLYIDVAPVDHLMMWEYDGTMDRMKTKSDEIVLVFLDTSEVYSKHPKFQRYPELNISKDDAEAYCKWRTDRVKILWQREVSENQKKYKYPKNILYRLPSTSEFEQAVAFFGYTKGKYKTVKDSFIFQYLKSYKTKYKKGIFIKDNISEYTLDGLPFGNNWKHSSNFSHPSNYVGFRCVCEILE